MTSFSILETFAIVFPLLLLVVAFMRGVAFEFMQIMAWIGGISVAEALFPTTRPLIENIFPQSIFTDFVTVLLVALPIALLISIVSRGVTQAIQGTHLGLANKGLGAVFGFMRGAVMVWLISGMMSWSFFQSVAHAYEAIDRGAPSAKVELSMQGVPMVDILCGQVEPPNPKLVRRLASAEQSMSPIIHEIWQFNRNPQDFMFLNIMRTVSVSICGN